MQFYIAEKFTLNFCIFGEIYSPLRNSYMQTFLLFLFQTELSPPKNKIVEKKPEDKLFDLVPMNRFDAEEMEKMERRKKMSPTSKGIVMDFLVGSVR